MRLTHVFAGALIVLVSAAARADTYETFNVTDTTAGSSDYAISGTLTFDSTTGLFTNSSLTTPFGSVTGAPTYSGEYPNSINPTSFYDGFGNYAVGPYVEFAISATSLLGYTGGNLCSASVPCTSVSSYLDLSGGAESYQFNTGAELTVDPAPEPSSLILLATGSLIAAGLMRRRRFV